MKSIIGTFIVGICQKQFAARVEREIRHKILPHLNRETKHPYPFDSTDEMVRLYTLAALDIQGEINLIRRAATLIRKPDGDIFVYIAYRDLHERIKMYLKLVDQVAQLEIGNPGPVLVFT